MTDAQSVTDTESLQAIVGLCACTGVLLFMWAATSGSGPGLGVAIVLWIVGGVLSVGVDPQSPGNGDGDTDGDRTASSERPREVAVDAAGSGRTVGAAGSGDQTSADALAELRNRYARGEVTETGFERRVERLLATDEGPADDDALRTLRTRYARGELSEEQFDRKLDRLTETRTLEDASESYDGEVSVED